MLVLITGLALVALVWAVYRLGRAVFGTWPGIVAALLTASSLSLLLYAARAYVDVPFLALVLWAAALEAERPRRGTGVMALLALAGLLRPEAWLLAGLYWGVVRARRAGAASRPARAGPRRAARLGARRPLGDRRSAALVQRDGGARRRARAPPGDRRGARLARALPLGHPAAPVLAAGLAGLLLAWRRREGRELHVPLVLLGAGVASFVAGGLAGTSLLPRYLTVPAIALAVFAGYAIAGWVALPKESSVRRRWSIVVGVLAVCGARVRRGAPDGRRPVHHRAALHRRGARRPAPALESPQVRAGRRCGPVTLPNYRLVPDARWILDASRGEVGARSARRRAHGVALFYADRKTLKRYGFAAGSSPSTNAPDAGYVFAGRHGRISVYVACP